MQGDRVMVFIDGSNLYHGLKVTFNKTNINFLELGNLLAGERDLERVYYYTAPVRQEMGRANIITQRRFLEKLRHTPLIKIRLGRHEKRRLETNVSCPSCSTQHKWKWESFVQKGVDVNLAVDLIKFAFDNLYEVGVIVSADGDFAGAIEVARSIGMRIENVSFRRRKSHHLMQASDSFAYLEDIITPDVFLDRKLP